jgi:hypothetical protein
MANKESSNIQYLFITIILIIAGLITHSDGVDDAVKKSPFDMLFSVFAIMVFSVLIYLIWSLVENYKKESETIR